MRAVLLCCLLAALTLPPAVAGPQAERAAAAPLADHRADHRDAELAHLLDVARDRLRLAALLGADPGVGARRVEGLRVCVSWFSISRASGADRRGVGDR